MPWILGACLLGNALEWYANAALHGLGDEVAASLLPLDFGSPSGGLLAVGLTVRFLAGLVIGHVGDRRGPARVLQASCLVLCVTTLLVGLLPPFAFMGWIGPIGLIFLWSLGAVAASGQLPAAALLAFDVAPQKWRGAFTSLVLASSLSGSCCGNLVSALLRSSGIATSGIWRVAFVLGGVLGAGAFGFQRCVLKPIAPPDRGQGHLSHFDSPAKRPICRFAVAGLVCAGWMVPAVVPMRWMPALLAARWEKTPQLMRALAHGHVAGLVFLGGLLSEMVGRVKILIAGHVSSLLWPVILWNLTVAGFGTDYWTGFFSSVILNASVGLAGGPLLAWLIGLLSTDEEKRCSRLTVVWNFFQAVLGGLAIPTTDFLGEPADPGLYGEHHRRHHVNREQHVALSIGLFCAFGGMLGLRGIFAGMDLIPPEVQPATAVAVYSSVVGDPNASVFGHREELNEDLEAELEEELVEVSKGSRHEAKPSGLLQRRGTAENDADEKEMEALTSREDAPADSET